MALSQEPQHIDELEFLRQKRQHRRIFLVLLFIDIVLMGLVVFDVLRLLGVISAPSSSESLLAIAHWL